MKHKNKVKIVSGLPTNLIILKIREVVNFWVEL